MPENLRRIYPLPNDLTPEIKAVTFAKCSRTAKPFDEIANELTEDKSSEFHEKWVVGFGHSSVAEHAVLSIAFENISILATKFIEDNRLCSYTEKSSRYQLFNKERYYMPDAIKNSKYAVLYKDTIDFLMDTYNSLFDPMQKFMMNKYPKDPKTPDKAYEADIRSKTCDNIRYLLPTCALTSLGMTANARNFEHAIVKMLSCPMEEIQDIGNELKIAAQKITPTLIKFANAHEYISETGKILEKNSQDVLSHVSAKNHNPVDLVDYDRDAENKIIAALLYKYSHLPYMAVKNEVMKMNMDQKAKIMEESLKRMAPFDQPMREFEHSYYTFDILVDYGAFRDIQRHRMCTQTNQKVTTVHGYEVPKEITEAGFQEVFEQCMIKAQTAHQEICKEFPDESQYVVPLAFRKRVLVTWSARELHHFIYLRSGKKGHQSYRKIAQLCWEKLNEVQPLIAKYIRVDKSESATSWAQTMYNPEFVYNPYANENPKFQAPNTKQN